MQRPNQKEHLKTVLIRERKQCVLTQEQVAEAIGVSPRTYQRWEQGETYPQSFYLKRLRKFFGSSIDEESQSSLEMPSETANPTETAYYRQDVLAASASARKRLRVMVGSILCALVVASALGILLHALNPLHLGLVKPGGAWISPLGPTVGDVIHFKAYAYPTNRGDPAIDHVNFTAYWQGVDPRTWMIACVARVPAQTDIYACDANIRLLGAPPGQIIISFDVYDVQGNANLSPQGKHRVFYVPGS